MRNLVFGMAAALFLLATAGAASADDWTVTRLRGTVEQLVGGQWQPLARGDVVPDERSIFTRATGHATLVRGSESIELGPNTRIEIYDQGGRKPFTTILQHAGVLTVEAEVRNVQHFAVRTTYLAAVVKGTRFTVTARSTGGAVEVFRGQVSVTSEQGGETVLVPAGQKIKVDRGGAVTISGKPASGAAPAVTSRPQQGSAGPTAGGAGTVTRTTTTVDKVVTKTTGTVEKVVTTTTTTVDKVVTTTTSTVEKVVDTATDTVDDVAGTVDKVTGTGVVGDTVGVVTGTLDKTTKGLTGLLGRKKK